MSTPVAIAVVVPTLRHLPEDLGAVHARASLGLEGVVWDINVCADRDRRGCFATMNRAARAARDADWILFLHDDAELAPNAVGRALDLAAATGLDPAIVHLAPVRPNGRLDVAVDVSGDYRCVVTQADPPAHDTAAEVAAVPFATTLMRADLFHQLGGFDEALKDHFGDIDLCRRVRQHGRAVVSVLGAPPLATHEGSGSGAVYADASLRERDLRIFRRKWSPAAAPVEVTVQRFDEACDALNCDKGALGGRGHAYGAAYVDLFGLCRPSAILELGVLHGASLRLWERLFPAARILGIDQDPRAREHVSGHAEILIGDAMDADFMFGLIFPFDLVIDDAGHRADDMRRSFDLLWPRLPAGGAYVVEDIARADLWSVVLHIARARGASLRVLRKSAQPGYHIAAVVKAP